MPLQLPLSRRATRAQESKREGSLARPGGARGKPRLDSQISALSTPHSISSCPPLGASGARDWAPVFLSSPAPSTPPACTSPGGPAPQAASWAGTASPPAQAVCGEAAGERHKSASCCVLSPAPEAALWGRPQLLEPCSSALSGAKSVFDPLPAVLRRMEAWPGCTFTGYYERCPWQGSARFGTTEDTRPPFLVSCPPQATQPSCRDLI